MRKKSLRIITCLFAIAFLFVGGMKVKGKSQFTTTLNGIPGVGGIDPCEDYSYVCISNLAGVRVSLYIDGSLKARGDVYDGNKMSDSFSNMHYLRKNKLGQNVSNASSMALSGGFSKDKFTSVAAQRKYYQSIVSKIEEGKISYIGQLLVAIGYFSNYDSGVVKRFVKDNYKKTKIMIEPLFLAGIQNYKSAQNVYYKKAQPNWNYYVGTASNIAEEVVKHGDTCVANNKSKKAQCEKIYYSRKQKGHVSRMANSLRLEKKALGISKAPLATKGKTTMTQLANYSTGYGTAIVTMGYFPPEKKGAHSVCYKIDNQDDCSNGDFPYYKITDVDEGTTKMDGACNIDNKTWTQSKFGKQQYGINQYCQIYCTEETNMDASLPQINGSNFVTVFGSSNSTDDQKNKFEIVTSGSRECKVDFIYVYDKKSLKTASDDKAFGSAGARVTKAEADLAEKLIKYQEAKDDCDDAEANPKLSSTQINEICKKVDSTNKAYRDTLSSIKSSLNQCINYNMNLSDFDIDPPTVSYDGDNLSLSSDDDSNEVCKNCEGLEELKLYDGSPACNYGKCSELCSDKSNTEKYGLLSKYSGLCEINLYEEAVLNRPSAKKTVNHKYYVDTKFSYDFNHNSDNESYSGTKTSPNGKYNTVGKINDDIDNVCKTRIDVSNSDSDSNSDPGKNSGPGEDTSLQKKLTITGSKAVCQADVDIPVNFSSSTVACECPPETIHAGTNAYQLYLQDKSTLLKQDAQITCLDAISKVCNNSSVNDNSDGYEPIFGEDDTTDIVGCLSQGIPYQECYMHSDYTATCTNGFNNKINITNQVWQYMKRNNITLKEDHEEEIWEKATKEATEEIPECNCDKNTKAPEKFVYRTIKLGTKLEAFPGVNGKGRQPGSNWNSDTVIKRVITDTKDVYSKEPMYSITLTPGSIKKIRQYNRGNDYGDFNLSCNENGAKCVSKFLNDNRYINVTGRCANVGQSDFDACQNYQLYGRS